MPSTQAIEVAPARKHDRVAFSIQEFCWRNDFSVPTYHKLKNAGLGPDELRIGNLVRITAKAEAKWQRERTYPQGEEAKARANSEAVTKARGKKAGQLSAESPRHVSKRKQSA